ncbi:MAG: hypothetical protein KKI14_04085 [Nanoarchaeota archaeon]|nr:hypothetical protein [Patescibacteria group bacterium]MBU4124614.1 hypothetical protein [Nanoarchaeota archaeon]
MREADHLRENIRNAVVALIVFMLAIIFWPTSKVSRDGSPNEPNMVEDIREYTPVMELLPPEANEPNELALTGLDLEYYVQTLACRELTFKMMEAESKGEPNTLDELWKTRLISLRKLGDEAIENILFEEEGIISLGIGEFREFYLDKVLYVRLQPQYSGVLFVWARPVDQERITEETDWPITKIIYGDSLKQNVMEVLTFLRRKE